jgi:transposase, IS30 family
LIFYVDLKGTPNNLTQQSQQIVNIRLMANKHHFILKKHDRERIEKWNTEEYTYAEIARRIGCHPSTISREIRRGTDSQGIYRTVYAHKKACTRIRSRKLGKRKIFLNRDLQDYVHERLIEKWSPKEIVETIKKTYTERTMQISPETIYQYIYVLPRGSLKKTLIIGLRRSHTYRRTQRQKTQDEEMRGKIKDLLSINERPIEVADRTIPGH